MVHARRLASGAVLAGLVIGFGVALAGCAGSGVVGPVTGDSGGAGTGGAGTAGATGIAGTTGTTGAAGTMATAGTAGTIGSAGASGTTGRGGTIGIAGTTGTAGTTGAAGSGGGTTGSGGSSATGGVTGSGGVGGGAGKGGAVGSGGVGGSGGGSSTGTPPSCAPGGLGMTDCGSGHENCCISLPVVGGTFNRTYRNNGSGPTNQADPATISNFRLDKYLVTVGRYRQFVAASSHRRARASTRT